MGKGRDINVQARVLIESIGLVVEVVGIIPGIYTTMKHVFFSTVSRIVNFAVRWTEVSRKFRSTPTMLSQELIGRVFGFGFVV